MHILVAIAQLLLLLFSRIDINKYTLQRGRQYNEWS